MVSRTLLPLLCGLSLAAQTLSPVQETLKAARSAARSGDVQDAQTQYQSAFALAIKSDPVLAAGIAVEKADLLSANKQAPGAVQSLIEAAGALQSNGAAPQILAPLANRLSNLARTTLTIGGEYAEAKQALEEALQILRDNYGPDALCVANVLSSLAAVSAKLSEAEAAAQQSAEAQRIWHANQTDAQVKPINSAISAPLVKYKIDPQYSDQARAAHLAGTVLLSVVVEPDGTAKNIQVQMPLGFGLDEEAINAVGQWRFQPATMKTDGQIVPVRATIEVNFHLL